MNQMANEKISVLFLLGACGVGGVERVTAVLANALVRRGIAVTVCCFKKEDVNLVSLLDARVVFVEFESGWLSSQNCERLRQILIDRRVTHIINQWCTPYRVTRFCRKASRGLGAKLIAVNHNLPTTNKRIQDSSGAKRKLWKILTAINHRLVYEHSDAYILLSETFVEGFSRFIRKRSVTKSRVISNPLTLTPILCAKENVILYVGRLEETQKRVSRVLDIWRELSGRLPEWRLEIIGDGPDRARYEQMSAEIPRVEFKGFQSPSEFYAKAKILLLTSDFEGYGLVLVEAMASKCVPIVLGSYSAAYEIVGEDLVVPVPFCRDVFVKKILGLIEDDQRYVCLQDLGLRRAAAYSVDSIVVKWIDLFEELKN